MDAPRNLLTHCSLDTLRTHRPTEKENWKLQALPLARIKKIMKSEEFIMQELEKDRLVQQRQENDPERQENDPERPNIKFMISGEAPVLMSKACEFLVKELSHRAWQHTERSRRRTLQRQDLHQAVGESEVYDFLIDIVPRVATAARTAMPSSNDMTAAPSLSTLPMGLPEPTLMNIPVAAMNVAQPDFMNQQLQEQMQNNQYIAMFQTPMQGTDGIDVATLPQLGMPQQQQQLQATQPLPQQLQQQAAQQLQQEWRNEGI
jgi:nuclear transcription factor Y gamma